MLDIIVTIIQFSIPADAFIGINNLLVNHAELLIILFAIIILSFLGIKLYQIKSKEKIVLALIKANKE